MSEYAVLPLADYVDACEATREMTGETEKIPSGQLGPKIRSINTQEDLSAEITAQDELIEQIQTALQGKAAGSDPVIQELTVTENGTYTAPAGVDGYSPVVVEVPETEPVTEELTVTENGEYTPDTGVDGYSKVKVNVPDIPPVLDTLEATENGTYNAPSGVDGYSSVVVDVPDVPAVTQELTVTENGTYTPPDGVDGFSSVEVAVPDAVVESVTVTNSTGYTAKYVSYTAPDGSHVVMVDIPNNSSFAVKKDSLVFVDYFDARMEFEIIIKGGFFASPEANSFSSVAFFATEDVTLSIF